MFQLQFELSFPQLSPSMFFFYFQTYETIDYLLKQSVTSIFDDDANNEYTDIDIVRQYIPTQQVDVQNSILILQCPNSRLLLLPREFSGKMLIF